MAAHADTLRPEVMVMAMAMGRSCGYVMAFGPLLALRCGACRGVVGVSVALSVSVSPLLKAPR